MSIAGDPAGDAAATGPDPELIAAALGACPSVAQLHAGPVASYLPGRRVPGVAIGATSVAVHVDLAYPSSVGALSAEVRVALTGLLQGNRLEIYVDDVVIPAEHTADLVTPPATLTGDTL